MYLTKFTEYTFPLLNVKMPYSDIKLELVVCVLSAEKEEHLYTNETSVSVSQL